MRSKILWVSAFQNAICNTTYLFWESPCQYLTFIWHFEMLIICNANISIPGAMRNANVMQMKCNANKCEKMHNSGSDPILASCTRIDYYEASIS